MKKNGKNRSAQEREFLKSAVGSLISNFKPNRILLFGSRAYGKPTSDSDLDLLIVKNTRLSFAERARKASQIIGCHKFPLDLIVLTPAEIRRRLQSFDPFLEEALTHGKILYEKNR